MTAADRPSVTDDARAERPACTWPQCRSPQTGKCFAWCKCVCHEWAAGRAETTTDDLGDAYMLGYAAAKNAETTTATDEDAARVIDALGRHWWSTQTGETEPWDDLTDDEKANVIENAYIDVLATPVLGLLATARTRPTLPDRETLANWWVTFDGPAYPSGEGFADAFLARFSDQPTEAEAGARALDSMAEFFETSAALGTGDRDLIAAAAVRERAARLRGGDR